MRPSYLFTDIQGASMNEQETRDQAGAEPDDDGAGLPGDCGEFLTPEHTRHMAWAFGPHKTAAEGGVGTE